MLECSLVYIKEEQKMMKTVRNKWYAHFWYEGKYYCDPLGAYKQEKKKAHRAIGALLDRLKNGIYVHPKATMKQAISLYLETIKGKSRDYIDGKVGSINKHISPFLGDFKILEIDKAKILAYKDSREEKGAQQSTLSKEMDIIQKIIQCVNENFKLAKLEFKNKAKKTVNTLRMEDIERISDFVKQQSTIVRNGKGPFGEQYFQIFWIQVYTGMDTGDVLKLAPKNIDFKGKMIRVELGRGKTGVEFSIPICPALNNILRGLPRNFNQEKTYFNEMGNSQVNRAIQRAFRLAGYDSGGSKMFRHFVVSQLANAGTPEAVTQKIVGHAEGSDLTRKVYTHIFDDTAIKHYNKAFAND